MLALFEGSGLEKPQPTMRLMALAGTALLFRISKTPCPQVG